MMGVEYMVTRQDEHGNIYIVADRLCHFAAYATYGTMIKRGHKQDYTVYQYENEEERMALIEDLNIIGVRNT